jgi:hypothetical protein
MTPIGFPPITVFDIIGDIAVESIHRAEVCKGQPCPFHSPTDHHMKDWTMTFAGGLIYRYCPHMQYHPDPDSLADAAARGYRRDIDAHEEGDCDGCCRPPVR